MVEAALFWALALYGAATVVYQCVILVQRRVHHPRSVTMILVVHNAQTYIEGLVRSFMMKTAAGRRRRAIVVIDVASSDDTPHILGALVDTHRCVSAITLHCETELQSALKTACLSGESIACVYDLRHETPSRDALHDVLWSF